MKNQQENVEMELEQFKLQCTQLTSELGKSHIVGVMVMVLVLSAGEIKNYKIYI
jgi:hypothetical protein